MRLLLITMPWQSLETPSIAIGVLHNLVARLMPDVEVIEYHANMDWGAHIMEASSGRLTPFEYNRIGDGGFFDGLGDWVFSGSLYRDPFWGLETIKRYAAERGIDVSLALQARSYAEQFIGEAADKVVEHRPDVVGFTSTFMQNVASLALARKVKERLPEVPVVLGGANCDGPKGDAIHRNHRFVDFVVRGEAESSFIKLLKAIREGVQPSEIAGVCWWNNGVSTANPMLTAPTAVSEVPPPNYDQWFEVFGNSPVRQYLSPQLPIEGARGCWWGQKHHCKFCGLNGSFIEFRSKPPQVFLDELTEMVRKYRVLDILPVENIMATDYLREVVPMLHEFDWDLRMHYEMKANLKEEQVALLAKAGIVQVQFGIESLSTRVLRLMDKGATGPMNVRLLRDCEEFGITVNWNHLYGFPNETDDDYSPIIDQFPAMVHLQPPDGASRIAIERFSPYHDRPELGFRDVRPASFYHHIYALEPAELADIAHVFEADPVGIGHTVEAALTKGITTWAANYPDSTMTLVQHHDDVDIFDDRAGWPSRRIRLTGWRGGAYQELRRACVPEKLAKRLHRRGSPVGDGDLEKFLKSLEDDGLTFHDSGSVIALATARAPVRVHGNRP